MGLPLTLSAGLAALLLTGCAAARPAGREHAATQPGSTVASSAATGTPVGSATPPPSTPVPTTTPVRASSSAPVPQTRQVVLRPVTATGRPATGFTVEPGSQGPADCTAPIGSASPVAVDGGIVACSPAALYAVACWRTGAGRSVLCYRDPWSTELTLVRTDGPVAAAAAVRAPSPLGLLLADGTRCWLRIGGAWSKLDGHPELFGTYSCTTDIAVWGLHGEDGIDRSDPLWRVRIAPMSGHGTLRTVAVRAVYYVGTAATP